MFAYQTLEQYELKQAALTLYGYLTANPGTRDTAPIEYNTNYEDSPTWLTPATNL